MKIKGLLLLGIGILAVIVILFIASQLNPVPQSQSTVGQPVPSPQITPATASTNLPTKSSTETPQLFRPSSSVITRTATNVNTNVPTVKTSLSPTSELLSGGTTTFSIGPGGVDVIPHQIIRTKDDRVYLFSVKGDGSPVMIVYWTKLAGFPNGAQDFSGTIQISNPSDIISLDAVYDGDNIIHVLSNDLSGKIKDRPFIISNNSFKPEKVLATNGGTVHGTYVGTSGLSGIMDTNNKLHLVYWSSGDHVIYESYSYDQTADQMNLIEGPTQMDSDGQSNHPTIALSPTDGSVTVAWVSGNSTHANIMARVKTQSDWGSTQVVSNSSVWASTNAGINIDQGPYLMVSSDGIKRLTYIENFRVSQPYDYGRVHYVTNNGGGWVDQYTGFYTHDPVIATGTDGKIFIIGHGYPLNQTCSNEKDMCAYQRVTDTDWTPKILIAHQDSQSFDSSPSVKWSVVGLNRPGVIEFLFSEVGSGYSSPTLYYGRIN